jgi:hypothetical protein
MAEYQPKLDLKSVLRDIFAAEGTVTVTSLWDRGWIVLIGDELNGFEAKRTFSNEELDFDVLASWLARTFAEFHPSTAFAKTYSHLRPQSFASLTSTAVN